MQDDPATWSSASETPDIAAALDTFEDICRQTISDTWPGKTPAPQLVNAVQIMVVECIKNLSEAGLLDGGTGIAADTQSIIHKVLETLECGDNPLLNFRCLRYVFNQESQSQTEIAAEFGVKRATVSMKCVAFSKRFGVHPGRGMRSLEAREVYAERAAEVHKARPKQPAQFTHANLFILHVAA